VARWVTKRIAKADRCSPDNGARKKK
jgi:hypothetical protein